MDEGFVEPRRGMGHGRGRGREMVDRAYRPGEGVDIHYSHGGDCHHCQVRFTSREVERKYLKVSSPNVQKSP